MRWTTQSIPYKTLASGDTLSITTHTLYGDKQGPHVYIQSGIHGAELQGHALIIYLMEHLKQYKIKGSITFVPMCNPYAALTKISTHTLGRINPVTGHNYNRNFIDILGAKDNPRFDTFVNEVINDEWSILKNKFKAFLLSELEHYENSLTKKEAINDNNALNLLLQKLASHADIVLDLHTGPKATYYLYCPEYAKEKASLLGVENVIVIPNKFFGAMDEACFMPWVHLHKRLQRLGRTIMPDCYSFTVELQSEESFSLKNAKKEAKGIMNFLAYKGVVEKPYEKYKTRSCLLEDFKTIYAPAGGFCDYLVHVNEIVKKDNALAKIFNLKNYNPDFNIDDNAVYVRSIYDGVIINRCPSSAIHQGMELLQMMTNVIYDES